MASEIKIKSNGLRNELKEIRKSIDKLTNVLEVMLEISHSSAIKHTNTYEKHNYYWDGVCGDDCECTSIKQRKICRDETGRSFGI